MFFWGFTLNKFQVFFKETKGPTPPWDGWHNQDEYNIMLMNKRPKFYIHLEKFEGNIFPEVAHIPRYDYETKSLSLSQMHQKIISELSRYGIGRPKMTLNAGAENYEFLFKVQLFPWPPSNFFGVIRIHPLGNHVTYPTK